MKVVAVKILAAADSNSAIEDLHKAVALVRASGPAITEESVSLMASATAALNRLSSELSASAELTAAPAKKIKMTPSVKKAALKKAKRSMDAPYKAADFQKKTYSQLTSLCDDSTYDETEIDGHHVGYWTGDKGNVIGVWYSAARIGSYNPKVKGTNVDPISFTEADPNWPYEA